MQRSHIGTVGALLWHVQHHMILVAVLADLSIKKHQNCQKVALTLKGKNQHVVKLHCKVSFRMRSIVSPCSIHVFRKSSGKMVIVIISEN